MRTASFGKIRWASIAASVALVASPRSLRAQTAEPGLTTVDPRAHGVAISAERAAAPPASGSSYVFEAFREHAETMRSMRIAGGTSSLIVGATLVGTGLVAEQAWDETYGTVLWVSGAVTALGGSLALVFPSEIERSAEQHGVHFTSRPTLEQEAALEQTWAAAAVRARSGRHLGAAIAFGFSGIALGSGIAVLASNLDPKPRHTWGTVLLVAGGAFGASGAATLMLESPTESAYEAFLAARGRKPAAEDSRAPAWRVVAAPLRSGAFVGVSAAF